MHTPSSSYPSVSRGSCTQIQRCATGSPAAQVAQAIQDSPIVVTGVIQPIPIPEQFSSAPGANSTQAGNGTFESLVKVAESVVSTKAGACGTSDSAAGRTVAQRRSSKGIVLPNKINLISAIRDRRAKNAELSCTASTIPPPCSRASAPATQQPKADVPPAPKFVSASSGLIQRRSAGACTGLHASLSLPALPSHCKEKQPPVPPSACVPTQHVTRQNNSRAENLESSGGRVSSTFNTAAPPPPASSAKSHQLVLHPPQH